MSIKNLFVLLVVLVSVFLLSGTVVALNKSDISLQYVEVNDVSFTSANPKTVEKANELEVLVVFNSYVDSPNFQIQAALFGADLKTPINDISEVFTVKAGNNYDKKFNLKLPLKMDAGRYDLRIYITDRTGSSIEYLFPLDIVTKRHAIEIRDIITSPENEVGAGKSLLVSVRVKNRGEKSEEDIKVKASIPELGISASDIIDELDSEGGDDDSATSEELFLRIPDNAKTGDYTVKIEVEFDNGDDKISKTTNIRVRGKESDDVSAPSTDKVEAKTVITVGPEAQDVSIGGSGVYALTITNLGSEARSYTIDVSGANWGAFKVSPSNVVVINKGESKALTISVEPKETASAGEQSFAVTVKSGDSLLKQVLLKANLVGKVSAAKDFSLRNTVEIGLIVLVVLLVIVALIIGFSKLKGDDEKPKEETYY